MQVQFSIRGRPFTVRTEDDGESLKQLAKQLDDKINQRAAQAKRLDDASLAIITALDILQASDLEKSKLVDQVEQLERDLEHLRAMVQGLLPIQPTE